MAKVVRKRYTNNVHLLGKPYFEEAIWEFQEYSLYIVIPKNKIIQRQVNENSMIKYC